LKVGINQLQKMIQMIIMFALNRFFFEVRGRSNGDPFLFLQPGCGRPRKEAVNAQKEARLGPRMKLCSNHRHQPGNVETAWWLSRLQKCWYHQHIFRIATPSWQQFG
jgi:hypothetical protein